MVFSPSGWSLQVGLPYEKAKVSFETPTTATWSLAYVSPKIQGFEDTETVSSVVSGHRLPPILQGQLDLPPRPAPRPGTPEGSFSAQGTELLPTPAVPLSSAPPAGKEVGKAHSRRTVCTTEGRCVGFRSGPLFLSA